MTKLKLAVTAFFLAFAGLAFTFSGNLSEAQSKSKNDKDPALLNSLAAYKSWKEIRKPKREITSDLMKNEPFTIEFSGLAG